MKQKVETILLPQNKEGYTTGDILKSDRGSYSIAVCDNEQSAMWQSQHLYIVDTSALIRENDWYIDMTLNIKIIYQRGKTDSSLKNCAKIIASTDPQCLMFGAGISPDFIKQWVALQGKCEVEMEVDDSIEAYQDSERSWEETNIYKNGHIFISKPKLDNGYLVLSIKYNDKTLKMVGENLRNRKLFPIETLKFVEPIQTKFTQFIEAAKEICNNNYLPASGDFYEGIVVRMMVADIDNNPTQNDKESFSDKTQEEKDQYRKDKGLPISKKKYSNEKGEDGKDDPDQDDIYDAVIRFRESHPDKDRPTQTVKLGENGERIIQHLKDKQEEVNKKAIQTIEKIACEYASKNATTFTTRGNNELQLQKAVQFGWKANPNQFTSEDMIQFAMLFSDYSNEQVFSKALKKYIKIAKVLNFKNK